MAHILIIEANFYRDIAAHLSDAAITVLNEANHTYDKIEVPGCFEVPTALAMAIDTSRYDGYIALGCVIRGETSHYDYVCNETARGLNSLARKHRLALGFGIITANTPEQAYARSDKDEHNVGQRAAQTCIHMLTLKHQLAS
jgi:6,7-dimethyl-8-ribityllumazine synthase